MSNVIVIAREGKEITLAEWQKLYGLPVGSKKIGKYFSLTEPKFQSDLKEYGKLYVNELLMRVADEFRTLWGKPLIVNSFNRSPQKQEALRKAGARAAQYSPHEVYLAMDIDTPGADKGLKWDDAVKVNREMVATLKKAAQNLNIKIRIGSEKYLKDGNTFIHLDVCPEYYANGKPWEKRFHPVSWKSEINW